MEVEAGSKGTRNLVIKRESMTSLLGATMPRTLGLVAAFSERQHDAEVLSPGVRLAPQLTDEPPFGANQFVIRSEVAFVKWSP